jgi:DNA-binding NarL/FixJ family response regulator
VACPRVLLIGSGPAAAPGIPSADQLSAGDVLAADAITSVKEALNRLAGSGYSAVVCWAEHQDELAALIRIRKANPGLPIMLFTPERDAGFQELARQMGATRILQPDGDATQTAEKIRSAVLSGELIAEMRAGSQEALKRAKELRALARENQDLTRIARETVRKAPRLTFIPLVIEGYPEMALRTVRALQKADVFAPLPVLRTREEGVAFLSNLLQPATQGPRIVPSILLLDGDLENDAALDLLKWVRSNASFSHLPVILFGSSADAARISRAYELGANSYILKPADFDSQVQALASLKMYWGSFNQGPTPY